ncbi:MAG: hypothetical protein JW772_03145 [Candidatus Diapherotrites archaeon]|nr:hypothetical protein [Candidatus Diapherotrites archaeon]
MIDIDASFAPYRLVLARREPVELRVDIANRGKEDKFATLEVKTSSRLSLDRVGYKTSDLKRLPVLKPGERKCFYFQIWPKNAQPGTEETVLIKTVETHAQSRQVKKEYIEKKSIAVE